MLQRRGAFMENKPSIAGPG